MTLSAHGTKKKVLNQARYKITMELNNMHMDDDRTLSNKQSKIS